jgi:dTMP kinase
MSVRDIKRGLFIVMEGMDGSGKSVGTKHFAGFLKEEGLKLIETREIGGTPFGDKIRAMIFNSAEPVDPLARMLACLASRQQHVVDVIQPAIERGDSVLSDRFFDSTFVYQACLDGKMSAYYELAMLRCLEPLFRRPDITVFFEVDPEVAFERGSGRTNLDNDQYKRSKEMAHKIAQSYQLVRDRLTVDQKKNIFVIDGNKTLEEVEAQLRYIARHIVRGYLDPQ